MREITDISNYLARMGYLEDIEWFPKEYASTSSYYQNFNKIYGFQAYYNEYYPDGNPTYAYATLDNNVEIDSSGYEKFLKINIFSDTRNNSTSISSFNLDNKKYSIEQKTDNKGYVTLVILDSSGKEVLEISLKDYIDGLFENYTEPKAMKSPEEMVIVSQNEVLKVQILINDISADKSNDGRIYISANLFLFVAQQ